MGLIVCEMCALIVTSARGGCLTKSLHSTTAICGAASGVVVRADYFKSSSPVPGPIRLGSRNDRLAVSSPIGYTRSLFRLPLPTARHLRSRDFSSAMRTASAIFSRNDSIPHGSAKEDFIHLKDPISGASGTSEDGSKQKPPRLKAGEEIRPHYVTEDSDMNSPHSTVEILNIDDDVEDSSPAPALLKAGGHEELQPLLREQQPTVTEEAGTVPPERQHSLTENVGHVAKETFVLTRLMFNLCGYLGVGYRWTTRFLSLVLYAMFLMPGFVQVGYHYFFSKNVRRNIAYGVRPRNKFDLYTPEDTTGTPKQVVIFVTGGAWIIGYKAWGALLGIQLSQRDVMVCCMDYRNFPQGGISDMVEDISTGIGFIVNNIAQFGGDPDRIYLAGQSAGSHIAACALVEQAQIEIGQKEGILTWTTHQMKAFLGVSGGYNLPDLVDHFHNRGLDRSLFLSVMEGETTLPLYSPELAVQSEEFAPAIPLLPPMYLFHGTADYSIPSVASENFALTLQRVGATAITTLYPDKTHTDVILQDPMRGGHDPLFEDVVAILHANDEEAQSRDAKAAPRRRLVPECLLHLAHVVSPF